MKKYDTSWDEDNEDAWDLIQGVQIDQICRLKMAIKNSDNTLFSQGFHLISEVQKAVKKQVNRMLFQMS